jgi:hypothetical protein
MASVKVEEAKLTHFSKCQRFNYFLNYFLNFINFYLFQLPALHNFSSFLPAIDASATAVFPMSAENATEMGGFMMDTAGLSTLAPPLTPSGLNFTTFFGGDTFSANLTTGGQSGSDRRRCKYSN